MGWCTPWPHGYGSKTGIPKWVALVSGNIGSPKPAVGPGENFKPRVP